jgi:hypothetical protein
MMEDTKIIPCSVLGRILERSDKYATLALLPNKSLNKYTPLRA